jgi:hypothetical protein
MKKKLAQVAISIFLAANLFVLSGVLQSCDKLQNGGDLSKIINLNL